jgi:predicted dehydrogenase
MTRAAIVGFGGWGRRLVASIQGDGRPASEALRFTHVATRDPGLLTEAAARSGLRPCTFEDALADPAVDAVVLATPHGGHVVEVQAAAAAGKHVFVEKPLALTRTGAAAAIASCQAAGRILAVGHNRRFLPAFAQFRNLVASGAAGEILHAEAVFAGAYAFGYQEGMWRADPRDSPAGGLTALGIHSLDALIHLLGPVERAWAQSVRRVVAAPMHDTTTAMLRFARGPTGHVTSLMATVPAWRLRLFGAEALVEMTSETVVRLEDRSGRVQAWSYPPFDTERAELEAFGRAVGGTAAYPVALEEVEQGVAALEAILASLDTAHPSTPPDGLPQSALDPG